MNDDLRYNKPNEDANENVEHRGHMLDGKLVERISKDKLEYVTKPGCEHKETTRKPADDFDNDIDVISCLSCPISWAVRRTSN